MPMCYVVVNPLFRPKMSHPAIVNGLQNDVFPIPSISNTFYFSRCAWVMKCQTFIVARVLPFSFIAARLFLQKCHFFYHFHFLSFLSPELLSSPSLFLLSIFGAHYLKPFMNGGSPLLWGFVWMLSITNLDSTTL